MSLKVWLHWRLVCKIDPQRSTKVIIDMTVYDERRQQYVKLMTKKEFTGGLSTT
jgi:hypothetical protein